jgi:DNA mismatch endonuclease (patch repair protein)
MRKIGSSNTKPELIVRSMLHQRGYRFRVCHHGLPGKPDIVLLKYRSVIFVNGCFWHRHPQCKSAKIPKSNRLYWKQKFIKNVQRDKKNRKELERLGWKVIVVWECQVIAASHQVIDAILKKIVSNYPTG